MAEDKTGNILNDSENPGSNTAWLVLFSKVRTMKQMRFMLRDKAPMDLFHKDTTSVLHKSSSRFFVLFKRNRKEAEEHSQRARTSLIQNPGEAFGEEAGTTLV